MVKLYTWKTTKVSNGFKFTVQEMVSRKTPNKMGQYADTKTIKTGIRTSRPKAKLIAQKWIRYFKVKTR